MTSKYAINARRLAAIALAISAAAAVVSCNSSPDAPAPPSATGPTSAKVLTVPAAAAVPATPGVSAAPATQSIGRHWIQDQRLRGLMAELMKRNPTWPAGLPQEPEDPAAATQPQQFEEIAVLANALCGAADQISATTSHITMSRADRAGFLAQARTLREQAAGLQAAANRRSIEQMQREMDGINATCISCHSRYRDFSGQLNRTQASVSGAGLLR